MWLEPFLFGEGADGMHACINKNNSWAFCMSKESIDDFFKIHKPRHNKFVFTRLSTYIQYCSYVYNQVDTLGICTTNRICQHLIRTKNLPFGFD